MGRALRRWNRCRGECLVHHPARQWQDVFTPEVARAIGRNRRDKDEQDWLGVEELYSVLEQRAVPNFSDWDAAGVPRAWGGGCGGAWPIRRYTTAPRGWWATIWKMPALPFRRRGGGRSF